MASLNVKTEYSEYKDFCGVYESECYTIEFFDAAAQATRPAMYKKNIVYEFPAE